MDSRSTARSEWEREYLSHVGAAKLLRNRSELTIRPLYEAPADCDDGLGYPGQYPYTRGIYPSMYRGRTWTQRQLIGLGTPKDYNRRLRDLLAAGATAVSLLPCNSVFRGYDMDEVYPELLGTCGVVVNTADHLARCLEGVDLFSTSVALNDPSPFTLLAFHLSNATKQGVPWAALTGTSNQSDYISHFVANHMFYRLDLDGARKVLLDEIEFCLRHVPRWNPLSVVGQHMQQAGATPAEAMGFTLSTALQYAQDLRSRGIAVDEFLPRFTFFFDVSISFFEEIAKFRAGRRIWARLTKERLGASDPRSWRFKFHGQTSGVDLTVQQPLNNIARVAIQAAAGIFSGLQSLHTDSFDEAISCPTEAGAQIAVNTQNILSMEAGLTEVIDPLGGSYYVEQLTDEMEQAILKVIDEVDVLGGMLAAVRTGHVQRRIDESALAWQSRIESGEQVVVGVNRFIKDPSADEMVAALGKPDVGTMERHILEFRNFKSQRSAWQVREAIDKIRRSASTDENTFAMLVEAADVGVTHGEMVAVLREVFGFGMPLVTI